MALIDIIRKSRSCRRFDQNTPVKEADIDTLIEAARLTPSARNIQPLKFIVSTDPATNTRIFGTLAWAGYLTDWNGPEEGERPSAYIIMVLDREISDTCSCDNGIIAQTIMLQATELGYGGCIIGAIKKDALSEILGLDRNRFEIVNVLALGKPAEEIRLEEMENNQFKYWRDEKGVHHVPKRKKSEILLKFFK